MLTVNLAMGGGQRTASGFCPEHHLRRPTLFGSVLREDFGASFDAPRP
jgi:predicted nucleotidyltransferase